MIRSAPPATWYDVPTPYMFFTGKGGVGKTSLACATAVKLTDRGARILLVSTDPASNLAQVFHTDVTGTEPSRVAEVPRLSALNIDPEAAARAYRDRIVGPVRGVLPDQTVQRMEEELSGACTTEIAAFDEFTALLTSDDIRDSYDHVIFDTAPTGHTLRLLKLPGAWSDFLASNQSGTSCLGPLAGLEKQQRQYREAVQALADAARTTVLLVSRPHGAALAEAARTSGELAALAVRHQRLIINGVMPAADRNDPLAQAMRQRDEQALSSIPQVLQSLPTDRVELRSVNIVGVEALRALLGRPEDSPAPGALLSVPPEVADSRLSDLVDAIEADGHGLVMLLGKGGVGKTTIAAAVALELARRGHDVLLSTTDPAAHVAATIESDVKHLQISRIDPQVETGRYREQVMRTRGKDLDDQGRALLAEDLRSPCTEEIAVFQAFSRVIRDAQSMFVVLDTAPTGHTLLLLDATGSYHRDVSRHLKAGRKVVTPMMRLQDPAQTKMLIVTLPETTPVLEAAALQEDLRRAGIEPWAWVVNASLAAADPHDALLVARARAELPQLAKVRQELARRIAVVPWLAREPVGAEALRELMDDAASVDKG